jgi:hypothetical protein
LGFAFAAAGAAFAVAVDAAAGAEPGLGAADASGLDSVGFFGSEGGFDSLISASRDISTDHRRPRPRLSRPEVLKNGLTLCDLAHSDKGSRVG